MGADDFLGLLDNGGVGVGGIGEDVAGEVGAFEGVVGSVEGAGAEGSGVALVFHAGVRAGMEVAGGAGDGVIAGELGIPEEGFAEDDFEGLELAGEDANSEVGVGQEADGVDGAGCEGVGSGG